MIENSKKNITMDKYKDLLKTYGIEGTNQDNIRHGPVQELISSIENGYSIDNNVEIEISKLCFMLGESIRIDCDGTKYDAAVKHYENAIKKGYIQIIISNKQELKEFSEHILDIYYKSSIRLEDFQEMADFWNRRKEFVNQNIINNKIINSSEYFDEIKKLERRISTIIQRINYFSEREKWIDKALKNELPNEFSNLAKYFTKEEKLSLVIIIVLLLLIISANLFLLFKYQIGLNWNNLFSSLITLPFILPLVYILIIYTKRYNNAKQLRIHYKHQGLVIKHIPLMVSHYNLTKKEDGFYNFIIEQHKQLYSLPVKEEKRRIKLKIKNLIHAELEEFLGRNPLLPEPEKGIKSSDYNSLTL